MFCKHTQCEKKVKKKKTKEKFTEVLTMKKD